LAEPIKVLVVDDHPVVRQGLRTFLDLQPDITVVGEASDGTTCVSAAADLQPDVILLDLRMPGSDGVAALNGLRELGLPARVLVITSFTDPRSAAPAIRAGARGYLSKDVDPQALVAAVRSVHAGHLLLDPAMSEAVLAGPLPDAPALTARERDVLGRIAQGRSNREIARDLSLSEKTVKTHVSSILLKLGVADRTQAALYAVRRGLSTVDP
jgi:DNA-binding NarL/FixJ family response regulator